MLLTLTSRFALSSDIGNASLVAQLDLPQHSINEPRNICRSA